VLTNSSGDPRTPSPLRSGPERPDPLAVRAADGPPKSGPRRGHEPPAAPIPLGPGGRPSRSRGRLSFPWPALSGPVAGGWDAPASSPRPAPPHPRRQCGGGRLEPISTPYGLAWGPHPIPPVPPPHPPPPAFFAVTAIVVVLSVLAGVGVGYAVWKPSGNGTTNVAANNGTSQGSGQENLHPRRRLGSSGTGSSGSGARLLRRPWRPRSNSRSRRHQRDPQLSGRVGAGTARCHLLRGSAHQQPRRRRGHKHLGHRIGNGRTTRPRSSAMTAPVTSPSSSSTGRGAETVPVGDPPR